MHRAVSQISNYWKGRPKRLSRRVAHDLRALAPALGILFCVVSTASVIAAAEAIPMQEIPETDHSAEYVDVSTTDAHASRATDLLPTRADCARLASVHNFD